MKKFLLSIAATIFVYFTSQGQISVAATLGTPIGSYTTLKGAFDAINAGTHKGAVTIIVNGDTLETASAVLNESNAPANYTSVLIKPGAGVNVTISGTIETAIIRLNAADNVTIDGSNNGSSSRNLSITNNFIPISGNDSRVIWITSTDESGADNVTIKNTNFASTISGGITIGICLSGSNDFIPEVSNNNFTAINNTFVKLGIGIFATGTLSYSDTGWIIRDNRIEPASPEDVTLYIGISVQGMNNFEVSGNVVTSVSSNLPRTASGIYIGASYDGSVFNNKISGIKNLSGGGAVGLLLNTHNTNLLIYNNTVSDVIATGNSSGGAITDNGNGIFVGKGTGYKIYHNTVVMNTNQPNPGRPSAINIGIGVTEANAIDLRNNIFVNNQTQTGEKYAIYSSASVSVFSNIDYNNYFSSGANLGFIAGANNTSLTDVKAAFGGNVNSLNISPVFVSATDFHLAADIANTSLDNKAIFIPQVTTDADGVLRNVITPDLGSFEFSTPANTDNFTKSKFTYNNPVIDYLHINHVSTITSIEIYTISGQSMKSINIDASQVSVDLRSLSAGIYLAKVISTNGTETIKIIKQ